jgi:hypothetical protein
MLSMTAARQRSRPRTKQRDCGVVGADHFGVGIVLIGIVALLQTKDGGRSTAGSPQAFWSSSSFVDHRRQGLESSGVRSSPAGGRRRSGARLDQYPDLAARSWPTRY